MGRHKKKRKSENVELNLAAMLDMAFQLLAFFVLTYKPAPVEGQINLRLPPAQAIVGEGKGKPGKDEKSDQTLKKLTTLAISVFPNKDGGIGSMRVGEDLVGSLNRLDERLRQIFGQESTPFEQVIIQAGSGLHYDALMNVIDVCTRQQVFENGQPKPLSKLSFVELSDGT